MRTVFDLVGVFRHVVRTREGDPNPVITTERKVLRGDMNCNQACMGKSVLSEVAIMEAQKFIRKDGLHRVWFVDWDLVEKQLQEQKAA